jgi:hypothetical protein
MDPGGEASLVKGRAAVALGSTAYWQNDFEATRSLYQEALEILRTVNDERGVQEGLYNVAFLLPSPWPSTVH